MVPVLALLQHHHKQAMAMAPTTLASPPSRHPRHRGWMALAMPRSSDSSNRRHHSSSTTSPPEPVVMEDLLPQPPLLTMLHRLQGVATAAMAPAVAIAHAAVAAVVAMEEAPPLTTAAAVVRMEEEQQREEEAVLATAMEAAMATVVGVVGMTSDTAEVEVEGAARVHAHRWQWLSLLVAAARSVLGSNECVLFKQKQLLGSTLGALPLVGLQSMSAAHRQAYPQPVLAPRDPAVLRPCTAPHLQWSVQALPALAATTE